MSQHFIGITVLLSVINFVWLLVVTAGYGLAGDRKLTFVASVLLGGLLVGILTMGTLSKSTESVQMERRTLVQSCMRLLGEQLKR